MNEQQSSQITLFIATSHFQDKPNPPSMRIIQTPPLYGKESREGSCLRIILATLANQ